MTLRSGSDEYMRSLEVRHMHQGVLGGRIMDCKTDDLDREARFSSRGSEGRWISS